MCRELFLNQSLEAGAGDKSAGITMSKHIATDLLPPTANFLLLPKLIECDECSPALLRTVSPSFWVVFFSSHSCSVILFPSFSRPPTLSCPCVSQSLHSFIITLLSHHVNITSPHSNSISLSHTLRSFSHSFFPVPLLFSHPFVGPHCLIPSFFLSALVLPLRAAIKRHTCSVVLHVNRIIGYGALSGGNITNCHQWN